MSPQFIIHPLIESLQASIDFCDVIRQSLNRLQDLLSYSSILSSSLDQTKSMLMYGTVSREEKIAHGENEFKLSTDDR